MPRKGYYSPALRGDLVKRLYFAARDMRVPMTVLNDRLVDDSLARICEAPIIPIRRTDNQTAATSAAAQTSHQPGTQRARPPRPGFFVPTTTER